MILINIGTFFDIMMRTNLNDGALHWWRNNPLSVHIIAQGMSSKNIRNVESFAKVRGKNILMKPGSHLTVKVLSQRFC